MRLFLSTLLLLALNVQATDRFAASASLADVTTAYNAAANGDNIFVPNGTATWASTLTVSKAVMFWGTNGGPVITRNGNDHFIFNPPAVATTRVGVSGFVMDGNNTSLHLVTVNGADENASAATTNLFICTNLFRNMGTTLANSGAISTWSQVRGVIASNVFDRCNVILKSMGNDDNGDFTNPAYTNDWNYGTGNNLFFENNKIVWSSSSSVSDPGWIESGQGARLCVRYNVWIYSNSTGQEIWDVHGFQNWNGPSPQTGTQFVEYYGNSIFNFNGYRWLNHRGVRGLFFNNVKTGSGSFQLYQYQGCEEQVEASVPGLFRSEINESYAFNCTDDGAQESFSEQQDDCGVAPNVNYFSYTASFNGTAGVGTGTALPASPSTEGVAFWVNATHTPTTNATITQAGVLHVARSGAWVEYFRPYTYPHPLRVAAAGGTVPMITSSTNGLGTNFVAFSYQITTDVGDVTAYGVTNLPNGVTLNTANGLISGTINISNVRTTNYVGLFATNTTGIGYTNMSFVIAASEAPSITSATTVDATNGIAFSYQITGLQFPTSYGVAVPDPVGYWKMDEASGTRIDAYGANNLADNATVTQAAGQIGNAAQFTAANLEFLSANDNAAFSFTTAFSLSIWVYRDTVDINRGIVGKWTYQTDGGWAVQSDGASAADIRVFIASGAADAGDNWVTFDTDQAATTWYHLTIVYDGSLSAGNRLKAYQNGLSATASASAGTIPASLVADTAPLLIGDFGGSLDRYWNGRIDEMALFNRALTADEAMALYESTTNGLPRGLVINHTTGVISGTPTVDGTFVVSLLVTNAVGTAETNLTFNIDPPAPLISVGQNFLFFSEIGHSETADQSLWVTNAGGGILTGYVATAASRFIVQAPTNYSLGPGAFTNIVIRYTPNVKATNTDNAVFIHNAGDNITNLLTGIAYPIAPALTFQMTNSLWNSPFTMGANLLEQASFTGSPQNGGRAVYGFTVPSAGTIVFTGLVSVASTAADSMFVNVDTEPTDNTDMVWGAAVTTGFESRAVTWFLEFPSTSPHVFTVAAGNHKLIVRGREPMQLREITGTFTAAASGGSTAVAVAGTGKVRGKKRE